jgi:hypothetical protein
MILSCHYFKTNFGNLKAALGTPAATAHFVPDTGPRCSAVRGEGLVRALLDRSRTLLHKSAEERAPLFPWRIHPTAFVTGMPRAV